MISVKNLCKSFGDHQVLRDINEHITPGEKVVIIGPSGSGKSTFLRCMNLPLHLVYKKERSILRSVLPLSG